METLKELAEAIARRIDTLRHEAASGVSTDPLSSILPRDLDPRIEFRSLANRRFRDQAPVELFDLGRGDKLVIRFDRPVAVRTNESASGLASRRFRPIELSGPPLSKTVLHERT